MGRGRSLLAALFLSVLLLTSLAGRAAPPAAAPPSVPARPSPQEIRGVWVTANDMGTLRDRNRMQTAVGQLAELNFNTIYPVVWSSGIAYYPSDVVQQRDIQSFTYKGLDGQDILRELIEAAHARNLMVMPWFEFGFMTPPTGTLARKHPDWLTRKADGGLTSVSAAGQVSWLNPFRPEVQEFITDMVVELVTNYDADGVQFDDHMSLPSDFGYDPFTIDLYRKETKKPPPPSPQDPAWVKWRAAKITAFMKRLHDRMAAVKPGAILSVSPNYYDFAYKLQLQDWLGWVRGGIADEVIVQVYRPDLDSFLPQLDRPELLEIRSRIPTAIGVMSGQRTRPVTMDLLEAQVRAVRQRGLGVAFFYFESLWQTAPEPAEERKQGLRRLFPAPAPRSRARA